MVVVGSYSAAGNNYPRVRRLNVDGTTDLTFTEPTFQLVLQLDVPSVVLEAALDRVARYNPHDVIDKVLVDQPTRLLQ